jgi:Uma2 family endonuclease
MTVGSIILVENASMTSTYRKNTLPAARPHPHDTQANNYHVAESPTSAHRLRVSEEMYWTRYYEDPDISYEWNNGVLEEKPLPDYRRVTLYGWFLMLLRSYLEVHPIAKLLFLEMGFRLALPDKTTIRKPDLFVIRNDNPVPLHDADRSYHGIADLCVESLSDSTQEEVERDTVVKKLEYAVVGVKEYYILDPDDEMAFYRRSSSGAYEPIQPDADGVLRSEVLPGFRFRIADLYQMPSLEMMAEDPIYRHFVLLKYQAEKQRAEIAEERAEMAEERAETAEERMAEEMARAERYAAILRNLGIEVD